MTTTSPTSPGELAAADPAAAASRWSRWSDRLNPILVREVQQAIKGRLFSFAVLVALALTVIVAVVVTSEFQPGGEAGRNAFEYGLAILVPLVLFVVPMQAYHSMRLELRGGIVEQLLLTRLRPHRILTGKLQAAMVQFTLYVAVVAPLLATSYLLRGVDLPTIVVTLLFAGLFCATSTMLTVSSAAQSVLPALQAVATLGTAFGLGIATFGLIGFVLSGEFVEMVGWLLRGPIWAATSAVTLLCGFGSVLAALAARAFLLHAFENKATPFRVALFVAPVLAFGWMFAAVDPARWQYTIPGLGIILLALGLLFGLFAVTEQRELSPRLRAHAPRSPLAALLVAPFLPGRDRGHLCVTLFVLVLAGLLVVIWPTSTRISLRAGWRVGALVGAYGLFWLSIGRYVRGFLKPTVAGNHVGRFLVPVLLLAASVLPILIDVFSFGEVAYWHVGHVLDPFFTVVEFTLRRDEHAGYWVLLAALLGVQVLSVPAWWRGVHEVLAAAAARRAREVGGAAPTAGTKA